MKKPLLFLVFIISAYLSHSQAGNNTCATATTLTVSGDCNTIQGDLYLANLTNPTGGCGNRADVWYRFTVPVNSTSVTIRVTPVQPTSINTGNTYIELYNTTNCTINNTTLGGCGNTINSARTFGGLTANTVYYFRVSTTQTPNTNSTRWRFNVCVTSNDNCVTATTLTPGATLDGNVFGASATASIPVGCSTGGTPDDDVWYRFTAVNTFATVTLSGLGSNLSTTARMQLFSGACGGLSSLACGTNANVINATGLTVGSVYYIRVFSSTTGQAGFAVNNSGFNISVTPSAPIRVESGRMKEIYNQTIISAPGVLNDPWEITYGPDGNLWVTEAKGYRLYRINRTTGVRDTVLNISFNSTFFTAPADQAFNAQWDINGGNNPQGGFAGMALHPKFLDPVAPQNFVYIAYVRSYVGGSSPTGIFYQNRLARFTYNTVTNKLESPVALCDTLPGSNDHNSQRLIIAPVGGTNYLFYASGDMGAGQFNNKDRPMKAQNPNSYEGKILRFNLISDGDAGLRAWIPNDNPYGNSNAVWCVGIRNNQGFAYDTSRNILYGSSHGPYSDDEVNIIQSGRNYGHPLVIGYAADNNYNGSTAGASNTTSSCPTINNEAGNAATIGVTYKDALFSAYARTTSEINNIWQTNPNNGQWPSEGWSGMDFYGDKAIPGWKNSLIIGSLKWGRVLRLKLGRNGDSIMRIGGFDTASHFGSVNRYRDLAFGIGGKDLYVVMDRSTTTSGPSAAFPVVPACPGCLQKYTFLGYSDVGGKSSIHDSIPVSWGTLNSCVSGTTITIDASNNDLWVPITGPDGNILAEIKANGNNLGIVTSSFYTKSGAVRQHWNKRYLNRNITITPTVQPSTPVAVRLYLTRSEFNSLDADPLSGVASIADIKILKNNDGCGATLASNTTLINPTFAESFGDTAYVLQGNISSFSTFYFGSSIITLPLELLSFEGQLQNNATHLDWKTVNETNTSNFVVERSTDATNFSAIGTVAAAGTSTGTLQYSYIDQNVNTLGVSIIYYRLKMVDIDGSFKYSQVISVTLSDIAGRVIITPNPATDETRMIITAATDGKAQWKVLDNTGRVVLNSSVQLSRGNNSVTLNLRKLAAGVYFVNVSGNGIEEVIKIQKQ